MNNPLRAGVIGMGIGRHHATSIVEIEDIELAAICDLDPVRLKQRGRPFPQAAQYTDYRDMFARETLDMVSVCVPNSLHAQVAIDALDAGLNVICEKPLAHCLKDAERIAAAVEKASGKLTVCYDKRYRADMQFLRSAVQNDTLGEIYYVEARWTRETGIPGGWFAQKSVSGGGALIDLGVHVLDAVLWALDFPAIETVSGTTRAVFGEQGRKTWAGRSGGDGRFTVEDGAVGFLRLAGGIPMVLEASFADHRRPREDDNFIRVAGSKAAIEIYVPNYTHEKTVTLFTEINGTPIVAYPDLEKPAYATHAGLIAAFGDAIRGDGPIPAPVAQGLLTVQILDAFYRSAAQGHEIALDVPGA